ncbi:DUF1127 domain-containing protein [Poseidonocella sedimentorum]|uniref:YjiS-like domain-containing protein n=1 Tax=Poseidonocella sedimentorum TaxID=871652 RepID=A0A1I6E5V6_9RHOB|nr:DUF1127 domain-containing protein [Poseidonocella sedimentorum]SFR12888.1 protein of unknown function [Poseidonocella sedimentorum]
MAQALNATTQTLGFADRFAEFRKNLADRWARYRVYQETLAELSHLDDRDLLDLGMSRSQIRQVALEAAYGN